VIIISSHNDDPRPKIDHLPGAVSNQAGELVSKASINGVEDRVLEWLDDVKSDAISGHRVSPYNPAGAGAAVVPSQRLQDTIIRAASPFSCSEVV
jgi:hypothetical protein